LFETEVLVRFGDLDPAGIAYYPNLVNYLHQAFEDFFADWVGRPYPEVFRDGLGLPTVGLEMEFLSPVRFGDRVRVGVGVERIGQTSVQFRYTGRVGERTVFRARNTAVVVEMAGFRPTPIPGWLRDRLEAARGEPGEGAAQ